MCSLGWLVLRMMFSGRKKQQQQQQKLSVVSQTDLSKANHTAVKSHQGFQCFWLSNPQFPRVEISMSVVSVSAQKGCGMEDFLPWQPLMQHRCRDWATAAVVIIEDWRKAGEMSSRLLFSMSKKCFLMSSVVNSKWHLCLWWKWAACICSAPQHHFYAFSFQRHGEDTGLSLSTWILALHYSSTLPILSSVSFTLFPISAYTAQSS